MTRQPPKMLGPALEYLKLGWSVVPLYGIKQSNDNSNDNTNYTCNCDKGQLEGDQRCKSPGKHTRIKWIPYQTKLPTEAELRSWWRKWPASNIGIITGAVSGIIVLDIDGPEGEATIKQNGLTIPPTVISKTGRGWHYIYKHPGFECRNFASQVGKTILPNVDFRGDGGLIVAPPSKHYSGKDYTWAMGPDMTDIAPAPEWLLKLIKEQAQVVAGGGRTLTQDDWSKQLTHGERDVELTRRAGSLLTKMQPAEALTMLLAWNKEHCKPPLEESLVQKIIDSIAKKQAAKPADPRGPVKKETVTVSETGAQQEDGKRVIQQLTTMAKDKPREVVKWALSDSKRIGALALAAHQSQAAVELTWQELRDAGVLGRDVDSLKRAVNHEKAKLRQIRLADPGEKREPVKVSQVIKNAPCPADTAIPDGWHLAPHCLARLKTRMSSSGEEEIILEDICPAPVVISGRLRDIADGDEYTRLAWLRDGHWQHATIERRVIANARSVVELAALGLPVTSGNSAALVDYLAAFEAENIKVLPRARVAGQLGWIGKGGKDGFLLGRQLLSSDGKTVAALDIDEAKPAEWKDIIAFRGADAGDDQVADAYNCAGTLDGWRQAVAPLAKFPRALLAVYASLAPPFLKILGAPNFAVDWSYGTSTGKTTVLRVAASCWGNPDERSQNSNLYSWDATRVWIQRACFIGSGLPIILDDTKRAKRPGDVASVLYDVINGRGRGRGSIKGMRKTETWNTVLLSSGEASAVSFTQDGGTRARVLTLWGAPFGKADEETGRIVQAVDAGIRANYGEPGKNLVQWLLKNRDKWPKLREGYQLAHRDYLSRSGGNSIAGRLAAYFAVLQVAADIADEALELPWDFRDPVAEVWEALIREAEEGDRAGAALAGVYSWAQANERFFLGREAGVGLYGGGSNIAYAGRWDSGNSWGWIGFYPHKLKEILESQDFESDPILRVWREREWIDAESERRLTKKVQYGGKSARMVVIRREALEGDSGEE